MLETDNHIAKNKIPVVILNWNGFSDTTRAVDSVIHQEHLAKVVLIDNASEQSQRQMLLDWLQSYPKVELVLNNENIGFAKAHNPVFRDLYNEGYTHVACLNNDAIADANWLKVLYDSSAQLSTGMLSSMMIQYNQRDRIDNLGHFMLNTGEIIPLAHGEPLNNYTNIGSNLGACAGGCLYDLSMLNHLGYFDEHFFLGYEDAELGLRAWLCGYDAFFVPDARVYHKMSSSIGKIRSADYLSEIQSHVFYTWFKLMPPYVVFTMLPKMIFKYTTVLIIDIFMLRFKYLKVMLMGIQKSFSRIGKIRSSRRMFYSNLSIKRTNSEILSRLTPFLRFDANRFWYLIVKQNRSKLEV